MDQDNLNFKAGEDIESRSFVAGFRSAWFRCKVKATRHSKGQIELLLEFFDYPDEGVHWTRVYQTPPLQSHKTHQQRRKELMIRPSFPPFYKKSQLPEPIPTNELVAIIRDSWKVGDLVDWWYEGCYWSGKITRLLGDDSVEIDLPKPPVGEGSTYIALCKDLRPSLSWSPRDGWTVPLSREHGNSWCCAQLLYPSHQGAGTDVINSYTADVTKTLVEEDHSMGTIGGNDMISKTDAAIMESKTPPKMVQSSPMDVLEKILTNERNYWNSHRHVDSIDSSIIELDELANKIRWLKGILKFGPGWSSNVPKPSWKFLTNDAS